MTIRSRISFSVECDTCHIVCEGISRYDNIIDQVRDWNFTTTYSTKGSVTLTEHECMFCRKMRESNEEIAHHRASGTCPF